MIKNNYLFFYIYSFKKCCHFCHLSLFSIDLQFVKNNRSIVHKPLDVCNKRQVVCSSD